MSAYSKKRGVADGKEKELKLDEKRRQWNMNLASRALEQMYGDEEIGDVIIHNRRKKRITYTADTLYDKGREYFENIFESNQQGVTIVPDIEDFCMFAKISRAVFLNYRRSDDSELSAVACNIANAIASCKKQAAYEGLINPMAFMADMNNNHDYIQARTETTINSNISLQQVDARIEDIASRIPMEDIPLLEGEVIETKEEENG